MPRVCWGYRHQCHDRLVLIHHTSGRFTCYYFAEYAIFHCSPSIGARSLDLGGNRAYIGPKRGEGNFARFSRSLESRSNPHSCWWNHLSSRRSRSQQLWAISVVCCQILPSLVG